MKLRYEVSPTESRTVIDGLAAQGITATLLHLTRGDQRQTIVIEAEDEDSAAEARDAMIILATDATVIG